MKTSRSPVSRQPGRRGGPRIEVQHVAHRPPRTLHFLGDPEHRHPRIMQGAQQLAGLSDETFEAIRAGEVKFNEALRGQRRETLRAKAALRQLEAEHEFATHTGVPAISGGYSSGDYCKQFDFSDRTVRRWDGEHRWGEMYAQALEETDLAYETLREYKWVAGAIDLSVRTDKVSFGVCRQIAAMPLCLRRHKLRPRSRQGGRTPEKADNPPIGG